MKKILVKKGSKEQKVLDEFLDEAFGTFRYPDKEIFSNKYIKPYLFTEDNNNIGVIVICQTKNISYLMMFAVNNKIRSKGYGTRIFNEYIKMSKGRKVVLEIELIDPKCKEYVNQQRRRAFYFRNNMKATGQGIIYFGTHNYELLTDTGKISEDDFKEIFTAFAPGKSDVVRIKIDKMFHVKQLKIAHKIGVIFDFNGTLYDDDSANDYCWTKIINKYSKKKISLKEVNEKCGDPKDRIFVKNFMKYFGYGNISNDEADKIWIDKELLYRDYCRSHKMKRLAEGTKKIIKHLNNEGIPYSIASMAPEMNFDFYYDYTDIHNYFNRQLIICDSDLYKTKIEMYKDAAKKINCKIQNCIVIEDSPHSIDKAIKSGVKKIIYINRKNRKCIRKEIIEEVKSLKEIDTKLIK